MIDQAPLENVPVPFAVVYSGAARALIGLYTQLRAMAWANDFERTPGLDVEELLQVLDLSRSQFYAQVKTMEKFRWIRKANAGPGRLSFTFRTLPDPLEDQAKSDKPDSKVPVVVLNIINKESDKSDKQQQTNRRPDKSDLPDTPPPFPQDLVTLLRNQGLNFENALDLASHYPDRIKRQVEVYNWARENGKAKGLGWLIRSIELNWDPPAGFVPIADRCPECNNPRWKHRRDCSAYWRAEARKYETG